MRSTKASNFATRLRRPLPLAILTLGLLAVSWGAVGLGAQAVKAADAPFGPLERRVGDVGTYEDRMTASGAVEKHGSYRWHFQWLEGEPLRDGKGDWHWVHPLAVWDDETQIDDPYGPPLSYVDVATGEPVAHTRGGGSSSWEASSALVLDEQEHLEETTTRLHLTGSGWPFCGSHADLHLRAIGDGDAVDVRGDCLRGDHTEGPVTMDAELRKTGDGEPAVLLRYESGRTEGTLLYVRDVPVPVELRWRTVLSEREAGEDVEAPGGEVRVDLLRRLVAFDAGAQTLGSGDPLPTTPPLPPVEFAPRDRWGPSEEGWDEAFPLREAIWEARERSEEFRTFLSSHPSAAVVSAEFDAETADGDDTERSWWFVVSDGHEARSVWVSERPDGSPLAGQPISQLLPGASGPTVMISEGHASLYPPPEALPPLAPTPASIVPRWEGYFPERAGAANAWAFAYGCASRDCSKTVLWVAVGEDRIQVTRPDTSGSLMGRQESHNGEFHLLGVDGEGNNAFLERTAYSYSYRSSGPLGAPPGSADLTAEPGGAIVLRAASTLSPVAPVATAGLGLAVLLAAALYAAWPAVKGSALLPLFSRIEPHAALENPTRREIFETIEARPGIHYQELVRTMGRGRGVVEHHVRKLVAAGLVLQRANAGMTCYFPKGRVDRRVMDAPAILRSAGARALLRAASGSSGMSGLELAASTGLAPATVSYHLKRLERSGFVVVVRSGEGLSVGATPTGREALGTFSPA